MDKFITRAEFIGLIGQAINGAMSNPANGHTIWDSYERQQLFQGLFADIEMTLSMAGYKINIEEVTNDG